MSRQIQIRRGNTAQHRNFTGVIGEITMDTDTNTIHVHDGVNPGGTPLARMSDVNNLPNQINDYVTETYRSENGNEWYRLYASGWVEQGGITSATLITLPVEMADTNYSIQLTSISQTTNNNITVVGYDDVKRNSFYTRGNILSNKSSSIGNNTSPKHWRVCGFATITETEDV